MKKPYEKISIVITTFALTFGIIILIYKTIAFVEFKNRNDLIFSKEKDNIHSYIESSKEEEILEKEAEFLEKNPIVYWSSLEEAELYTNIPFVEAPDNIFSYVQESYASVGTDIIQVSYKSPEGEYLILRKSLYDSKNNYFNISGDFSEHAIESIFSDYYVNYILIGDEKNHASSAYWDEKHQYNENERCSYSISSSVSVKEGLMLAFCEIVHSENEKVMKQFSDYCFSSVSDLFANIDIHYSEDEEYQSIIKAYEDYLTKDELKNIAINSNEEFGKARFWIVYLNSIPSILVSFDSSHVCGVHVLTFDNEKEEVAYLGEFSSFGSILMSEQEEDGIWASFYGSQGYYIVCLTELNEKFECSLKDVFLDQNGLCFHVDYIPEDMNLDGSRNDGWFESLVIESDDEYAVGECEDELKAKYGSMNRIDYSDMYTIWSIYELD